MINIMYRSNFNTILIINYLVVWLYLLIEITKAHEESNISWIMNSNFFEFSPKNKLVFSIIAIILGIFIALIYIWKRILKTLIYYGGIILSLALIGIGS